VTDNPPLSRRMPGFEARHATRRARRSRGLVVTVLLLVIAGVLVFVFGHRAKGHPAAPHRPSAPAAAVPKVTSTLASWRLGAPISRAVVLAPNPGGTQLDILGGSTTGGLTASGAFALDVTAGTLTQFGDLTTTVDNASGAVINGTDVVFGGQTASSSAPTTSIETLSPTAAATGGGSPPEASSTGTLPQARAAGVAVTSGTTTYLVGGENSAGDVGSVVATTDGQHFSTVATLALPVQFPAVVVEGKDLYVFGGVAGTGAGAGQPVATVQVVDLKTHKVTDTAHLPVAVTGAGAVVVNGHILVAGGDTTAPAAGSSPSTAPTSTATVWSFDPTTGRSAVAGHLAVAVSHAGVAVLGSTAWLVGGESNGTPVSSVQSMVLTAPVTKTKTASR
jgi:Kelch motif protein